MNELRFTGPEERRGYSRGFKAGYSEGLKKAVLLIQVMALSSEEFKESILQNSKEAVELRKIFIESEG